MNEQQRRFDANGNDVTDAGNLEDAIRVVEEHHARAAAGDTQAQQLIDDAEARMRSKMEADGSLSATGAAGPQLVGENRDPEPHDDSSQVGRAAEGDESKPNPNAEPLAETTENSAAQHG